PARAADLVPRVVGDLGARLVPRAAWACVAVAGVVPIRDVDRQDTAVPAPPAALRAPELRLPDRGEPPWRVGLDDRAVQDLDVTVEEELDPGHVIERAAGIGLLRVAPVHPADPLEIVRELFRHVAARPLGALDLLLHLAREARHLGHGQREHIVIAPDDAGSGAVLPFTVDD